MSERDLLTEVVWEDEALKIPKSWSIQDFMEFCHHFDSSDKGPIGIPFKEGLGLAEAYPTIEISSTGLIINLRYSIAPMAVSSDGASTALLYAELRNLGEVALYESEDETSDYYVFDSWDIFTEWDDDDDEEVTAYDFIEDFFIKSFINVFKGGE